MNRKKIKLFGKIVVICWNFSIVLYSWYIENKIVLLFSSIVLLIILLWFLHRWDIGRAIPYVETEKSYVTDKERL